MPSRKRVLSWLAGVATVFVCGGVGALVVIEGGLFDVAATTPDPAIEGVVVHTTMIRSVRRRAVSIVAPARFTSAQVEAGLRDYDVSCSGCHGGPGLAEPAFAHGMTPAPPYIVDAARQWRARELYWIIAHGVKMTAMPAWGSIRSDCQIWDIVAFLEAAPYLSPSDYARIREARPRGPVAENISRGKGS